MKIEHIECQVICDGQVLTEYQEKDDGQRAKSCHIISEAGKSFTMQWQSNPHEFDISFHLWIDGNRLRKKTIDRESSVPVETKGALVNSSTIRPFKFSNIVLTDDDGALQDNSLNVNDLGIICVKVYRVKDIKTMQSLYSPSYGIETGPVHEKSKKAGSHRVTLGEAQAVDAARGVTVTYIDTMELPYYTFTWRYRSKDILQAQGIVPLDPSPPSAKRPGSSTPAGNSSKRPRTERSPPQQGSSSRVKLEDTPTARELQARRDAIRAQRAALDAQEAEIEEELRMVGDDGVKRETSPIILIGASSRDVIDLTGDD